MKRPKRTRSLRDTNGLTPRRSMGLLCLFFKNKKQEISRAFTLADRWKVTVDGNRPGMNERGRAFLSNLRIFFQCATGGTSRFIYFFFVKLFARNQLSSRLHLSNFRLRSDIFSAILVGVKAESLGIKSHRGDLTVRFKW